MNLQIALLLGQDGLTSGAVYALLALSLVLVFSVTRVLLVPQGEFVTFGALTMAGLQAGKPAALAALLLGATLLQALLGAWRALRHGQRPGARLLAMPAYAAALLAMVHTLPLAKLPMGAQAVLTLALVVPFGP